MWCVVDRFFVFYLRISLFVVTYFTYLLSAFSVLGGFPYCSIPGVPFSLPLRNSFICFPFLKLDS